MVVRQLLPCSAKRAAASSQPVQFLEIVLRARDGTYAQCFLSRFSSFLSPPPMQNPPPVDYCCSREVNGAFVVIDLLPAVWLYDRCVGDGFSRTGLAQELSELVGPSPPISAEAYGWRRSCSATDCDVRRRGWLQALQRLWSRPRLRVGPGCCAAGGGGRDEDASGKRQRQCR